MFTVDEVVNHAALNGAGAVERVQGGQVFDGIGPVAAQHVPHAVRFKLKYAGGQPGVEDLFVGFRIGEDDIFEHNLFVAGLRDELERIVENGQRSQAQEVHFQQAELLNRA